MSLSIGIVGLPNVGKSTLFNALTNNNILAANYPFATIEPNTGIVPVPDNRLDVLQKMYNAEKTIPATVTFVDIAGLVAGASQGEGLGNKFLANIRQCDAIIHVVRAFDNDDIVHVNNRVDPGNDIEIINTELILAVIQTIERRINKLSKEAKANPNAKKSLDHLNSLLGELRAGNTIAHIQNVNQEIIADLHLLTAKPIIYVFNLDEEDLSNTEKQAELRGLVAPTPALFINARFEQDLNNLSDTEITEMLEMYGVEETGLAKLIQEAYKILGLQSYLTAGPKEVRAWTIKKGSSAPVAAGVIHTDFERGFIAAQVVNYADLIASGSEIAAKNAGKVRTEGKDYIMQPNDVVEFRFNV